MKQCTICLRAIKDGEFVVGLILARFKQKSEATYDLEVSSQTITSHVFCVKAKEEMKPGDTSDAV